MVGYLDYTTRNGVPIVSMTVCMIVVENSTDDVYAQYMANKMKTKTSAETPMTQILFSERFRQHGMILGLS